MFAKRKGLYEALGWQEGVGTWSRNATYISYQLENWISSPLLATGMAINTIGQVKKYIVEKRVLKPWQMTDKIVTRTNDIPFQFPNFIRKHISDMTKNSNFFFARRWHYFTLEPKTHLSRHRWLILFNDGSAL